jgi:hypothetical protein
MHSSPLSALRSRLAFLGNPLPREGLRAGLDYLRRHPGVILTTARNFAGLRLTLPIEALRWLVDHMPPSKKAPKDVALGTAPPAISVAATSELMGNAFRAGADVTVEDVRASTDELVVTLRVDNMTLKALGAQDSPMANLFKAMDMSNPAALLNMLPQRSPALIEAKKNRFVVDFLKIPKIASSPLVRRALEVVTPLLSIADVRTEGDLLTVGLRARPGGLSAALAALRNK